MSAEAHNQAGRKVIAILANFPAWLYTDELPDYDNHYDVWLVALHESLERQDEKEVHWVTFSKNLRKPLRFTSRGQQIHVLPRYKRIFGLFTLYAQDRIKVARSCAASGRIWCIPGARRTATACARQISTARGCIPCREPCGRM